MSINSEVIHKVNEIHKFWKEFKDENDKKSLDVMSEANLRNLNDLMNQYEDRIANIELSMNRPGKVLSEEKCSGLDIEHKKAFSKYLRKGIDDGLINLEAKSLSTRSEGDGGYFITRDMQHHITDRLLDSVALRKLANIQNISSDALEIIEDYDHAECGWANESNIIEDTETPKLSKKIIPVHEIYAQPKATQRLIDDSSVNIESWIENKLADSFAKLEDEAFIRGDGLGKPRGILTYEDGKNWGQIEQIKTGTKASINADSVVELLYSLPESYMSRASFLMNRQTIFNIRMLKNNQGEYLWSPGVAAGEPNNLLGIPIYNSESMPIPEANSLAIALADFSSAYLIVDRSHMKIMRDPFTEKPFVKFYTTKRVGGDVVNFNAIKLLKIAE